MPFYFFPDPSPLTSRMGTVKRYSELWTPESLISYCGTEWFISDAFFCLLDGEHDAKVGFLTHYSACFVKLSQSKPGLMVQISPAYRPGGKLGLWLKANLGLWFKFSQEWLASRGRTLRDTRCSFNVYCDSHVATTGHKGWLLSCQVGKEDSAIYCQLFFIDVIYVSNLDEEQLH